MTATAAPKPRAKLTLRDTTDLSLALDRYIDDHIDELELNGGALPDDLAQLFDEIQGAQMERVDAIAAKIDDLGDLADMAKARKDREARRERIYANTQAAIKAYALREVERLSGPAAGNFIKGRERKLRLQNNSGPSTDLKVPIDREYSIKVITSHQAVLLGAVAAGGPLAKYITLQQIATLDKKAVASAYEVRRTQLEDEASLLGEGDIPERGAEPNPEDVAGVVADLRAKYVATQLAAEFPGVIVSRGYHLRID